MKHELIKELYYEWQDYNEYFQGFIYFNEFLKYKGYKYSILGNGKNNLLIYKLRLNGLTYIITDFGKTLQIRYYNKKLKKYVNIHKYLI